MLSWDTSFFNRLVTDLYRKGFFLEPDLLQDQHRTRLIAEETRKLLESHDSAMEIHPADADEAPQLCFLLASVVRSFPFEIRRRFKGLELNEKTFASKLQWAGADGIHELHLDNAGVGGDLRKISVVYFAVGAEEGKTMSSWKLLNPIVSGENQLEEREFVSVEPEQGSLLVFWSDQIPHKVSKVPKGIEANLTVWIMSETLESIGVPINPEYRLAEISNS